MMSVNKKNRLESMSSVLLTKLTRNLSYCCNLSRFARKVVN